MKGEFKITCEESCNNMGFLIKRKGYKGPADWNELSRDEQIRVLKLLATGIEFLQRFLKEE